MVMFWIWLCALIYHDSAPGRGCERKEYIFQGNTMPVSFISFQAFRHWLFTWSVETVTKVLMTFSAPLLSPAWDWGRGNPPVTLILHFYSLAAPIKEGRRREVHMPLRWSHWLVDLLKCAVYMPVLNVLTLRGTVEQLASAVPERLTRGSRAHSVSCWQSPELTCITYFTLITTYKPIKLAVCGWKCESVGWLSWGRGVNGREAHMNKVFQRKSY